MKSFGGLAQRLRQEIRERLGVEPGESFKLYDIDAPLS